MGLALPDWRLVHPWALHPNRRPNGPAAPRSTSKHMKLLTLFGSNPRDLTGNYQLTVNGSFSVERGSLSTTVKSAWIDAGQFFSGLTSFTITVRLKFNGSTNVQEDNIVGSWDVGADQACLLRWDTETSSVEFFTYTSSQVGGGFSGTGAIGDGLEHTVTARYDGAKMHIFVDGRKSTTEFSQTGSIQAFTANLGFGGPYLPNLDGGRFHWRFARVDDRALSDAEIYAMHRHVYFANLIPA